MPERVGLTMSWTPAGSKAIRWLGAECFHGISTSWFQSGDVMSGDVRSSACQVCIEIPSAACRFACNTPPAVRPRRQLVSSNGLVGQLF